MNDDNSLDVPVKMTSVSLSLPPGITYDEWAAVGVRIQRTHRSILFWAGDWLLHGQRAFGERFAQAIEVTGHSAQTLMNGLWVCERIEPSRRREKLSFTHHAEVAALSPSDQEIFLSRAVDEGLSTRELRLAVREFTGKGPKAEKEQEEREAKERRKESPMEFDLKEWTTESLVTFYAHVDAAWASLAVRSADADTASVDCVAEGDLTDILNRINDELYRRNESSWVDVLTNPPEGVDTAELLALRLSRIEGAFREVQSE